MVEGLWPTKADVAQLRDDRAAASVKLCATLGSLISKLPSDAYDHLGGNRTR
jgi:hypothetical protein